MVNIVRAQVAHTPRNPFVSEGALHTLADGAVAFSGGRILACGPWSSVSGEYADAVVVDARDSLLLPGFVDCHVHYPQVRVIGAMGLGLLDWLRQRALPEEARLADSAYAAGVASEFVRGLAAAGTTTALVFGSHFASAQEALCSAALASSLRVFGGLVVSDRGLLPSLHVSPAAALDASRSLISRWQTQMLLPSGIRVGPAELLWLATGAGAAALGLADEVGDLSPGKSADFVLVRPVAGSALAAVLRRSESVEDQLRAVFTLAREESIAEVRVAGEVVWPR